MSTPVVTAPVSLLCEDRQEYDSRSATNARTPQEPDLILSITYPNMAALDKIDEADAIAAKLIGPNDVQNKAAIERGPMREVLGTQLMRELILK